MSLPQKKKLIDFLQTYVGERITSAQEAIASAIESRDSATKSTAGDKHETGRAMMQMELDNSQLQLKKAQDLKMELERINPDRTYDRVEFGSLVTSNHGIYFISIGIGKIEIDAQDYFVISLASPIGSLLHNKAAGEQIEFNGSQISIQSID